MTEAAEGRTPVEDAGQPEDTTAAPPAGPTLLARLRESGSPLVLTTRGKKRRRYSRGYGDVQKTLDAQARVNRRFFAALAAGADEYCRRADKSARRKRDGLLKDGFRNSAFALRTVLRKSSKVPRELARMVTPTLLRQQLAMHVLGRIVAPRPAAWPGLR